ncbi:MAG: molybdopterin-dependent oxidoreductase, partial [Saprospiraceae bacterium]|nr:molybdopterin-dependent oxidoreductase [Saprospiraceae bacterium]
MTNKKKKWTRRAFIIAGGVVGGGLAVGVGGMMYVSKKIKEYTGEGFGDGSSLNAWIRIAPDNTIIMAVPRAEMGQGVYTSMPMLIAEELEVEMNSIKVIAPQPESPYANPFIVVNKPRDIYNGLSMMEKIASFMPIVATGGSTTIRDSYDNLRAAGASAREMLIQAAATQWGVDRSECYAQSGYVINKSNSHKLSYGELATAASQIELSEIPKLKDQKDFKILGKPVQRLDIPEKVTGEAEYGLDARVENMLYAAIRHATYHDGQIQS